MPTIRVRSTAAAGATTVFPLQGNQYEYLPFNARVEFALVGADGATAGIINDVTAGPISDKSAVTGQTTGAVYPDDFLLDDVAAAGERLSVELNIPADTTFDSVIDTVVKITPL